MSSDPPPPEPEETPAAVVDDVADVDAADAARSPPADGGSSKHFTQGEITFVTLMSFVVVLAGLIATYVACRRRRKRKNELVQLEGTGKDVALDMEANIAMVHLETANIISQRHDGGGGPPLSRPPSRRRSSSMERRGSMESGGQGGRRRSTAESSSDGEYDTKRALRKMRRASNGSSVSSTYKQAAIDHMNQISQAGRHD
eukprot:CAMPEP_0172532764 /NCGR_PEP_ID=MMETSP1067-20121228/5697_1 /TAXON_ID=265564 ORGANISM="Thalassiosira punctigera, Strain Tpunct2005C2" /NCGR_SAMPLE_ID=MMETSP1067 /ASSEMBLY_ACC=CAM_ASM_000444 /LENGTH=200 /DNA_ID=CAMNT_0013317317 /DNA_START=33 /DNA_END=635 /DNA_ORIENTATION=+